MSDYLAGTRATAQPVQHGSNVNGGSHGPECAASPDRTYLTQINAPRVGFGFARSMSGLLEEIQRWRMRADQLRASAELVVNEVARDAMLDMAEGYDRLAARMAQFHAKRGASEV